MYQYSTMYIFSFNISLIAAAVAFDDNKAIDLHSSNNFVDHFCLFCIDFTLGIKLLLLMLVEILCF